MRRLLWLSLFCLFLSAQQPRPSDWISSGGGPQRTGREVSDSQFTKDTVKDFKAVLNRGFETGQKLHAPLVVGRLISYKGFKELAFVTGTGGEIWAVDVDLDLIFWHRQIARAGANGCGVMPMPAMMPAPTAGPGRNAQRTIFAVAADGKLYRINPSTGDDLLPPLNFLAAGANASNLAVVDNAVYTTTAAGCGGAPDSVWRIDAETGAVSSFETSSPPGEVAVGAGGTVYVQTGAELLALTPRDLQKKASFRMAGAAISPVVISYKGRELVATVAKDGKLSLLDGDSLAPLDQAELYGPPGTGISSWEDWILAPGAGPNGNVTAFRIEDGANGRPVLVRKWVSGTLASPQPPVTANGVVFTVSGPVLHAFDALTGSEIYSTKDEVKSPVNPSSLALANRRVYFTTADGTLRAFGPYLER